MDLRLIDQKRKGIEFLLDNAPAATGDSFELRSHWARYLCVVVSGYIESAIRQLMTLYSTDKSSPAVARYVSVQIKWFQNAKFEEILALLRSFEPKWESDLLAVVDEEHKAAINSIIGNRHAIAHGDSSSVTISSLKDWYKKANEVVDVLISLCER